MSNNKGSNEENLDKAKSYLKRFSENIAGHFINGQFEVPTNAETFENFTPVDNTTLGKIVSGSTQDIDRACDAAKAAFADWRDMSGAARKKLLNHFADKIAARATLALWSSRRNSLSVQ